MFATQPAPSTPTKPFRHKGHYTPVRPSPLGPHSTTAATPPWTMGSPTPTRSGASPISFPNFTSVAGAVAQTEQPPRYHNPFSPSTGVSHSKSPSHTHSQSPSFTNIASSPAPFIHQPANAPTHPGQPNNIFAPQSPTPTSPTPSRQSRFAERYAAQIANPMRGTTSLARSKTRAMFLNRVRSERDTGRFEARGEQMMMAEHLADKRRWEESMAREADGALDGVERDIEDDGMLPVDEDELRALEEYLSQEEAFERAAQESISNAHRSRMTEPDVPFSDADYDDIFMQLQEPAQDMDMS
ncbi:Uncharacterized protein PECH_008915 [Penicillium ucsense]|uniref:Uncharacterized protein n=1 Tax=Penicillium ucsense TaxID=2839758 RepID=A0A8J8WK94_9EURO|nr:Uncharacterized protein PECM_004509 [Penicillium ucsense]KAF7733843.1 Uncharacterized protein PECH_008915 [Penicillium ucsense]